MILVHFGSPLKCLFLVAHCFTFRLDVRLPCAEGGRHGHRPATEAAEQGQGPGEGEDAASPVPGAL